MIVHILTDQKRNQVDKPSISFQTRTTLYFGKIKLDGLDRWVVNGRAKSVERVFYFELEKVKMC